MKVGDRLRVLKPTELVRGNAETVYVVAEQFRAGERWVALGDGSQPGSYSWWPVEFLEQVATIPEKLMAEPTPEPVSMKVPVYKRCDGCGEPHCICRACVLAKQSADLCHACIRLVKQHQRAVRMPRATWVDRMMHKLGLWK